jgi:hypothetical protein
MDTEDRILIAIALPVAVIAHCFIRRFFIACVVIAFASPALYAVESFIRLELAPAKVFWLPLVFWGVVRPRLALRWLSVCRFTCSGGGEAAT